MCIRDRVQPGHGLPELQPADPAVLAIRVAHLVDEVHGIAAVGIHPVSYTHLDVYKRQEKRNLSMSKTYTKTRTLVECALMIAIGTVLSNIKFFTPVSYTHLMARTAGSAGCSSGRPWPG